ncbi:MAG TPA: glycoside hydrolase family 16 protein [Candidatus Sulfotelmatobacter sp.]|nr:glycoside hydrolase family 16 protein [Candidatus Sulfotelmatobacter sp.]
MTLVRTTICGILLCALPFAQAQTISWAGHTWKVTRGGMAGVAPGDPANVRIDSNGYLHLQIVQHAGKWTAAELFTTDRMGFGTYQWVIEGNVYEMDPTTVLGLFPYGPTHHIGADAENEIDIEFSQWNKTCHGCNADFTVYPSTGNRKPNGDSAWEDNFYVSGENLTTARMEWSPDHIVFTLMKGVHAIGAVADVMKTETYTSTATNIPQLAFPVGVNLWCFKQTPAKDQSVIIREFQYAPPRK